jgi:hypothetical protein
MPKRRWTESEAIQTVIRNGLTVDFQARVVILGRSRPGVVIWAALDYLRNICGFRVVKGTS